jgi:ring-1,2-phenylacetyl-CoA epoxidase subunit PaaE
MENISLKVDRITRETPSSKTFYFNKEGGALVYKAGQFITLLLTINNKEIRRSYSLGSTPGIDDEIFITFKRVENGAVSRFLYDHIKEGDILKALPPAGRFTIDEEYQLYFFIAAGSGITPIFSLIKEVLFKHLEKKIILIYQNNNERESIYRPQILSLKNQFPDCFNLIEFFSNPHEHIHFPHRINNISLEQLLLTQLFTTNVIFYLCGPLSFMRMADFTLKVMGFKDKQIRRENFVVDFIPKAPFINDTSVKEVVIHFNHQSYRLQVAYPHNILEVALKHNIQLPYSCRGGRCSTCAATCLKGRVKMSINEVLTEEDLDKGLVLTCVGYPETDVELAID